MTTVMTAHRSVITSACEGALKSAGSHIGWVSNWLGRVPKAQGRLENVRRRMRRWAAVQGDLGTRPVPDVLRELAAQAASGRLHVAGDGDDEGLFHLRRGLVCAAAVSDRPHLGGRLLEAGAVTPEALEEAQEAQRVELPAWGLGKLLVHLGHAEPAVIAAVEVEQLRDAVDELRDWTRGRWWFRPRARVRLGVAAPHPVETLLADVAEPDASPSSVAGGWPGGPDHDALLALRQAIDLPESPGWPGTEHPGLAGAAAAEAELPPHPLGFGQVGLAEVTGRSAWPR